MRWYGTRSKTPIGIDIGRRYVKAAQLTRSGQGWCAEATACFPRAKTEATIDNREVRRIHRVLSRQGFDGNEVILGVPSEMLLTGILELPLRASGAPLEQIARAELARMYKRDPETVEVSCWDLPIAKSSSQESTMMMAAGCSHDDARELLSVFEDTEFHVAAMDAPACALARACGPLLDHQNGVVALADLGWNAVQLLLLHEGVIVYESTLQELGIKKLYEALAHRFGLDHSEIDCLLSEISPDTRVGQGQSGGSPFNIVFDVIAGHFRAIAEDLRSTFSKATHQYGCDVELLLLVGGGADIPGVSQELAKKLHMALKSVTMEGLLQCPPTRCEGSNRAALACATGLAQFVER